MTVSSMRMGLGSSLGIGVAGIAVLAFVGCGGAPAPAAKSQSPEAPMRDDEEAPPRSIEEAQARIARARESLEPHPQAEPSATSTPKTPGNAADAAREPDERCASPCRALASMRRAVDALCRLAGDTDARCASARNTLSESAERVASCACK